jgi:hypothetical protein
MDIGDVSSPNAVFRSMTEFDQLGRTDFLHRYGFGAAREWYIDQDTWHYDAKAVLGRAHSYQFPDPTVGNLNFFKSGKGTVNKQLKAMGFTIVSAREVKLRFRKP